jgi:hypothetical protein
VDQPTCKIGTSGDDMAIVQQVRIANADVPLVVHFEAQRQHFNGRAVQVHARGPVQLTISRDRFEPHRIGEIEIDGGAVPERAQLRIVVPVA